MGSPEDEHREPARSAPKARRKFRHRLQEMAGWAVKHYPVVAGLIAVIVSGLYGLAYARFYEAFSVTPEQVGLSTAQIVAHSAIGGLALWLVISLGVFLAFLPAVAVREDLVAEEEVGTWSAFAGHAALGAFSILALIGLGLFLNPSLDVLGVTLVTSLCFTLYGLRWRKRSPRIGLEPKPMEFVFDEYLALLAFIVLPVAIFTGVLTVVKANELGRRAAAGEAVRDPEILEMPILGVRAEPALISWRTTPPRAYTDFPDCALYLGTANDRVLLYDHRSGSTAQVPSGDVDLLVRTRMTSCEAPRNISLPSVRLLERDRLKCMPGGWQPADELEYSYLWLHRGDSVSAQQVLKLADVSTGDAVRCRVKAETKLGDDVATSAALIAGEDSWMVASTATSGR